MPVSISNQMKLDLAKLEQNAMLDLYEVDLRTLKDKSGNAGSVYRFYSGLNELKTSIVWQGRTYDPYPIEATGFERNSSGPSNRPTLTLSNLFGLVTGIANQFDECIGAIVRRHQVYAQYLDAVNFAGGNAKADPNQEIISHFVIEQLTSLTRETATFTLALPIETDNAKIPSRIIMADTCTWIYRSAECGYTGKQYFDEKDKATSDPKADKCSHCLNGCELRGNQRNFGGFVSVNKLG
ncbi:TPA: phage minor tail protein L [Mannheimia haemolytica]|uniref:phage minor tail protein L n=1 Tax=Mannheimia haemolytica TaxID=75985 RepID=UPI00038605C8|nr:phage minor tail protein L [Mannheimia haemolytica]EPY99503.1 tail protein [Mannheimia haemolytica D35]MDW0546395.1 phage minor tail protein L [Mannheimia haemolytica]MDW0594376.1 phage minor tail protein L [Mannheimia haemolytica]MDW0646813.1 phage minor tail protein L [Mannheimia haemolytica]MDW1151046.1 phage minor tail protein L [Mannheimia haemolytica]